ncbi:MAG: glycoside hydrolase family 140 protein [Sedimentisphaerales bacterium]|nr:glycoside hydrolase family 140 protein [Sedimentisphaerales bacterium]
MKTAEKIILRAALLLIFTVSALAEQPIYPVKASDNGRYFVDQKGNPVFWLGITQWQIFREYTLDEARLILENAKSKGFAFVQAMLMGVGDGTQPNVYGQKPWIDNNPLTPNEAYFKNVDSVVQIARENNLTFSVTLYHQRYRKYITLENARAWAKWLARRYKDVPNIVWSMTPEAKQEFVPILRELAAGLYEGDGGLHIITFKPDPAPYSSSFIHEENWLAFDSMQTWNRVDLIYPMVSKDYNLKPVKPVLMAEGAYEAGTEYGFEVTPLWIRRQAYYSYLTGGHHTYGHNDSWRVLPTWKKALDAPGAFQMGVLKKIFLDRKEWWYLVPDQSIFAGGGNTEGKVLNLAARHKDGKWVMVYLGGKTAFSINMNKITAGNKVSAFWVDPKTGDSLSIGSFPNTQVQSFSTPDGWEDAILILEATNGLSPPPKPG